MKNKTHSLKIKPSRFLLGSVFTLGAIAVSLTLSEMIMQDIYKNDTSDKTNSVQTYKYTKPIYTGKFESDLSIVDKSDILNPQDFTTNTTQFSDAEITDIKKITDDEYLAYATYKYICDKYDINIFNNIAQSELTHYNTIFSLIKDTPVSENKFNEMFFFEETQILYDSLTTQADTSVVEALKIGLKIEELDIKDLENVKINSSNPELINIYNNLQKGSRNHLRSFYKVLSRYGETYTPEHLTQEEFNTIILSPMELNKI